MSQSWTSATPSGAWSPTGKPVAPLSFANSLRERQDLVVKHPDHKGSGLKPWLSVVGVKAFDGDIGGSLAVILPSLKELKNSEIKDYVEEF